MHCRQGAWAEGPICSSLGVLCLCHVVVHSNSTVPEAYGNSPMIVHYEFSHIMHKHQWCQNIIKWAFCRNLCTEVACLPSLLQVQILYCHANLRCCLYFPLLAPLVLDDAMSAKKMELRFWWGLGGLDVGVAEQGSKRRSTRWKEVGCRKTRGKLGASQCIWGMCTPEVAR
jgi:hypothetical protein